MSFLRRGTTSLPNRSTLASAAFTLFAFALVQPAGAQSLARPGWAGSGMSLEPWWSHSVFYEVDPHGFSGVEGAGPGTLKGLTSHLEYIRSLGVDAITVTHFAPEQGDGAARFQTVDPAVGGLDDFDDLVREASRDSLRLIVELDPQQISDPAALAAVSKFWLSRGVAGISLRSASTASAQLHRVTKSFSGQRILIDQASPESARGEGGDLTLDPTLRSVTQFNAASIRAAMEHLQHAPTGQTTLLASDGPDLARSASRYGNGTNDAAAAKVLATILLGTRANAQLYFGQEIGLRGTAGETTLMPWGIAIDPSTKKPVAAHGPEVAAEEADTDSLLTWYRRLIDLHHGNATMRSERIELLNHDDQNSVVWVSRRQPVTPASPAIVVACNLSDKPVTLSLTKDMSELHLRGNFLRTVLRSDNGMGGMSLNAVTLPPFGVYIGEIRF